MAKRHYRQKRVADTLHAFLGACFFRLNDERMKLVTMTAIEMSNDLSVAKIFWTMLKTSQDPNNASKESLPTDQEIEAMSKLIKSNIFHLKSEVAKGMNLRIVPDLRFHYDTSAAYAHKIDTLLDSIKDEDN